MNTNLHIAFAAAFTAAVLCSSVTSGDTATGWKVNDGYKYNPPSSGHSASAIDNGYDFEKDSDDGRFSVGVGITTFILTKNHREADMARKYNFIGAVNDLHEVRQCLLTPVIDYRVSDYFRIELSYVDISASTENFNNHVGDGCVRYLGPSLALEGTYPLLDGRLIPHIGAGVAFLWGDFEEDTWWHLGYSNYEAWELYNKTYKTRLNYFREIQVDEFAASFFCNLGMTYRFNSNWSTDFTVRHMLLDPDCEWGYRYTRGYERHNVGDFDLTHFGFTLSVSYTF